MHSSSPPPHIHTRFYVPAGEHSVGNIGIHCNAELISADISSVTVRSVAGGDDPGGDDPDLGFKAGIYCTKTTKITSSEANTTDLPARISPLSPPSPTTGGDSVLSVSSPCTLCWFSVR